MSRPPRFITALLSDVSEHCMPCISLNLAVSRPDLSVSHFGELAVGKQYSLWPPLRLKAAMSACLATLTQRAALAACEQFGEHGRASACVRWVLGPLIGVERPFDRILEEPVPIHRARVVDQDQVALVLRRAQSTSSHLSKERNLSKLGALVRCRISPEYLHLLSAP